MHGLWALHAGWPCAFRGAHATLLCAAADKLRGTSWLDASANIVQFLRGMLLVHAALHRHGGATRLGLYMCVRVRAWRRERVHPLMQDGMMMITWANHHYLDFAKTWIYHVKKVRYTRPSAGHAAECIHPG